MSDPSSSLSKRRRIAPMSPEQEAAASTPTTPTPPEYEPVPDEYKVFNDAVHGHMELHPLIIAVIDTDQFQRLRNLKQLGVAYLVFPTASHNRFEHSIGVAHLAGRLATRLQTEQPDLGITEQDVLCVQLAGLCHDLGHGPFSHQFEDLIKKVRPEAKWEHEHASIAMFDYLYADHNLAGRFRGAGLNVDTPAENDLVFIKELIQGSPLKENQKEFLGRSQAKHFLYQIVANKINGIDVDKWDYFHRDAYMLGIKTSFDHDRLIYTAKALPKNAGNPDERLICFRDKEVITLYDMFGARDSLHRRAYQHKTVKIISTMINEILVEACAHLKVPGKDGVMKTMPEAIDDMVAYMHLTDEILWLIQISTQPELEKARHLLKQVRSRKLYKWIHETKPVDSNKTISDEEAAAFPQQFMEIAQKMPDAARHTSGFTVDDLVFITKMFSYGMKHEDPIAHVRFYKKNKQVVKMKRGNISNMLPSSFQESMVALALKTPVAKEFIDKVFDVWAAQNKFHPRNLDGFELSETPLRRPAQEDFEVDLDQTPTAASASSSLTPKNLNKMGLE